LNVTPAKAGVQCWNTSGFNLHPTLDPGFRRGDGIPFEFIDSLGKEGGMLENIGWDESSPSFQRRG